MTLISGFNLSLRHFLLSSAMVISVLEKLLSQSTEQDNPGRLVIEAAHGSVAKVRELVQKHPEKVGPNIYFNYAYLQIMFVLFKVITCTKWFTV